MNMNHPAFVDMPNGKKGLRAADGSLLECAPINLQVDINIKTVLPQFGGEPPLILDAADALVIQTTMAAHWFALWQKQNNVIADLRAQLNEASGEGRVYELPADVAITVEELGQLKEIEKALDNFFDITDAEGIEQLYQNLHGDGIVEMRPLPDELEVALRKLGVSTVGGLREFLTSHNLRREAQLVDG